MLIQPDLHYKGPLTVEYIDGLRNKLSTALQELEVFEPPITYQIDKVVWEACLGNWRHSLDYADRRCIAVSQHVAQGQYDANPQLKADGHKCIDITLSMLRDYQEAKNKKFLKEYNGIYFGRHT